MLKTWGAYAGLSEFIVPRPGWVKTLAFRRRLQHVIIEAWERVIGNQATAYLV